MNESLYANYERELLFIRQMAQEFARQYPAAAGRLLLEPNRSTDPHVERLIESFALLAGRIRQKLDDDFPELTSAMLSVLYPHYLAPIPSAAVVQFELDPARAQLPRGYRIERGARLRTQPVSGVPCRYRTAYPVTLWPISVSEVQFIPPPFPGRLKPPPRTAGLLRVQLDTMSNLRFADLSLERLRLYLSGDGQLVGTLYETILNHTLQVVMRSTEGGEAVVLDPAECLTPAGFEREEALLPYPDQSLPGYRILTEFFAFAPKFWFVDVTGWERLRAVGAGRRVELLLFCNRTTPLLEQGVDNSTIRLGATPVVNLFEQTAEPIVLNQTTYEYRIVPDVAQRHGLEVYSVQSVSSTDPATGVTTEYQPFYSYRHGVGRQDQRTFWHTVRRAATASDDPGTEVYLNLVNLDFQPQLPAESVLVVRTLCTNRGLPLQLQRLGERVRFDLEGSAPLARIRTLRTPTPAIRPPTKHGYYWRLISHLNLNHLALSGQDGHAVLRELLALYDFPATSGTEQQSAIAQQLIEGVVGLSARRITGRIGRGVSAGFCRGLEITLELDEEKYVGTGAYLFASVLERFFALYASINSFTQLVLRTRQEQGEIKRWRPRAGEQPLL
jgi:type VI secretion system protein ImpG